MSEKYRHRSPKSTEKLAISERWAWALTRPVPHNEWCVLQVLAQYANGETLECEPAVSTIATTARLSVSTVRRALRYLERYSYIMTTMRSRGREPSRYVLTPTCDEVESIRARWPTRYGGPG